MKRTLQKVVLRLIWGLSWRIFHQGLPRFHLNLQFLQRGIGRCCMSRYFVIWNLNVSLFLGFVECQCVLNFGPFEVYYETKDIWDPSKKRTQLFATLRKWIFPRLFYKLKIIQFSFFYENPVSHNANLSKTHILKKCSRNPVCSACAFVKGNSCATQQNKYTPIVCEVEPQWREIDMVPPI